MAHDVFISYEKTDKAIAGNVCTALESAGIKCWISPRDNVNKWPSEIVKAINSAKAMVVLLSAASNNSQFVMNEVGLSFDKKIPIFVARMEEVGPSENLALYLHSSQWYDMWGSWIEINMPVLTDLIKQSLPPSLDPGEKVSPKHIALAYKCWRKEADADPRFEAWDKKFNQRIYRLDLNVEGLWNVLKRIDYVEYFMHPSWKWAGSSSEYKIDKDKGDTNFRLRELIWGNFLLYAEVHLDNQDVVPLSCYVQLPAGKGSSH